jgi:hypothetical protein
VLLQNAAGAAVLLQNAAGAEGAACSKHVHCGAQLCRAQVAWCRKHARGSSAALPRRPCRATAFPWQGNQHCDAAPAACASLILAGTQQLVAARSCPEILGAGTAAGAGGRAAEAARAPDRGPTLSLSASQTVSQSASQPVSRSASQPVSTTCFHCIGRWDVPGGQEHTFPGGRQSA